MDGRMGVQCRTRFYFGIRRRRSSDLNAHLDSVLLVDLRGRVRGQSGVSVTVALHAVTPCVADPAVQFLVVLGTIQRVQCLAAVLYGRRRKEQGGCAHQTLLSIRFSGHLRFPKSS